jgi:hypothetical protein
MRTDSITETAVDPDRLALTVGTIEPNIPTPE